MVELGEPVRRAPADDRRWTRAPEAPPAEWPVDHEPQLGERDDVVARLEYVALRAAMGTAVRLPEPVLARLIGGLARLGRRFDRRHSDAGRRFLEQALGPGLSTEVREERVLGAYRHFFRVIVESERFLRRVPFERTFEHASVTLCGEAREILDSKRGCVLVTPHLGNWELASLFTARLGFQPLYVIGKPPKNRFLGAAMQEGRERRGIRVLARRGAMRDAPKVVEAGGIVGMLLDQRARSRPAIAPFFGRPARCDRSAGVLIRRLKAPLVFMACYREPGRPLHFDVRYPEVIQPDEVKGLDAEAMAARINASFERMILEHPDQYFWLHDRYKEPAAAAEEAD